MAQRPSDDFNEKRAVIRTPALSTYTAEVKLRAVPIHQLKLRDTSRHGACLLIKKDSAIIKHLAIGQTLNILFHSVERSNPTGKFKTMVRHITEGKPGRFSGHYLVGVKIIERMTHT